MKLALVAQLAAIAFYVSGVKSATDVPAELKAQLAANPDSICGCRTRHSRKRKSVGAGICSVDSGAIGSSRKTYLVQRGDTLFLNLKTNPVEFVGLITALAGTFFIFLFSFRTEKIRERLPSLDSLDSLMYKTASLAFAGLAMLLITGAIWANESWGRPWGFDSKETARIDRMADLRRIFTYENFTRLVGQKFGLFCHCRISSRDLYVSRRKLSASGTT